MMRHWHLKSRKSSGSPGSTRIAQVKASLHLWYVYCAASVTAQRVNAMSNRDQARHQQRLSVSIPARIISKVDKLPATIDDLSCNGCRIGNHVRQLQVGSRVTIKFEGLEPLSGPVRWSSSDFAGVQFEAPLHPSVLDRLFRMHGHR